MVFYLLWMRPVCAGKRQMNLLSLNLKQQLRSCAGSLERLKMWKIKPGIWFTTQVALYVTVHGHFNRFVLEVCGCWWQCCGGMFVGTRPVFELRTDKSFLKSLSNFKKFIESLFFLWKSYLYVRTLPITIVIQNKQITTNMCKQASFYH